MASIWYDQARKSLTKMRLDLDEVFNAIHEDPSLGNNGMAEGLIRIENWISLVEGRLDENA